MDTGTSSAGDRLYARWLDELWSGDLDELEAVAARVVAPGFVGHWPHRPGYVHGPAELAAVIRESRSMFARLTFELTVGPLAQGDLVAARWRADGEYEGRPSQFHGHDILRHDGTRFVEYWSVSEQPAEPAG